MESQTAALHAQITAAQTRINWLQRVAAMLPAGLQSPTLSNEGETTLHAPGVPGATLSFSRPYNAPDWTAGAILAALESAGWSAVPATVAAFAQWSGYAVAGEPSDVPDRDRHGARRVALPVASVWIESDLFSTEYPAGGQFRTIMRAPDGSVYSVHCEAPAAFRIVATIDRGRFGRPDKIQTARLPAPNMETVCGLTRAVSGHELTRVAKYGENHFGGRIYWTRNADDARTVARIVSDLETTAAARA